MHRSLRFFNFLLGCALLITPLFAFQKSVPDYKKLFRSAERLSAAENHTDQTDAEALKIYIRVVSILETSKTDDPFLLKAYVSTGAFLQVLGLQKQSIKYFKSAFEIKDHLPALKDSVIFKPLVYCGNSYYQLDKIDSAEIFYKKAEVIAEKYPKVNELERLYNTLGVVAYSTGNYKKSITYYEKAVSSLLTHPAYDKALFIAYKNNLATAYRKLKRYDDALKIYQQLLPYHIETDNLLHNIGSVYLAMGDGAKAASYLKKVKSETQNLLNDLGRANYLLGDADASLRYLQKASEKNLAENGSHKTTDYGITLKYMGDAWMQKQQVSKALGFYQGAINNLLVDFHSNDIYTNPTNFNSVFNTIELLDVLLAKAEAFDKLYGNDHQEKTLEASLQTYLAFYKLADHIERFYETDDARLLISDKKYLSHQQPINICLQLYGLTKNKKYAKQAFLLDEENKANTLSLYLEESKIKARSGVSPQLLAQETDLKEKITRGLLKASGKTDSLALNKMKEQVNDYTLQLIKVQQKIGEYKGMEQLKFAGQNVPVDQLQKKIPSDGAILSYHIGDKNILCFMITANDFDFFTTPLKPDFFPSLKEIYKQAQYREGNNARLMRALGRSLYDQLLRPAEKYLNSKKNLMIIPDDELNYLPFEILVDGEGESLLKKYTITYNYSCAILQNGVTNNQGTQTKLGMAPFNEKIMTGGASTGQWIQLAASGNEIGSLQGTSLLNKQATKQRFLKDAQNFNIIHLATHAYANDRDPNQSYILFYPSVPDSVLDYKLYLPEIYNLKLNQTRLIILSACESGAGELVKGEGLMSLSRAFSYAGCNNIITSMWKADDESTAYISGRLHEYLQKNYSIAAALQQARLDYLADDRISSARKLTGYWAHLRLTGNFEESNGNNLIVVYIVAIILICAIIAIISRNRLARSRTN